jgi:hypothetical protein
MTAVVLPHGAGYARRFLDMRALPAFFYAAIIKLLIGRVHSAVTAMVLLVSSH